MCGCPATVLELRVATSRLSMIRVLLIRTGFRFAAHRQWLAIFCPARLCISHVAYGGVDCSANVRHRSRPTEPDALVIARRCLGLVWNVVISKAAVNAVSDACVLYVFAVRFSHLWPKSRTVSRCRRYHSFSGARHREPVRPFGFVSPLRSLRHDVCTEAMRFGMLTRCYPPVGAAAR